MTHPSLHRMLSQIDLFAGVPEGVVSDLVAAGSTHTTPAGRTVVAQGDSDAGLQVVLEGSVDVEVNGVRRPEILPGGYFGEISVIDGAGRSATLVAGKDGLTTFAISPLSFSPLIDKHPELARSLLKALCARLRAAEGASNLA